MQYSGVHISSSTASDGQGTSDTVKLRGRSIQYLYPQLHDQSRYMYVYTDLKMTHGSERNLLCGTVCHFISMIMITHVCRCPTQGTRERDAFNYVNVWVIAFGAHRIYNGNTAIHFMLHLKFSLL